MLDFEVIVLDMDDTLYLERDYVRSGFAAVGKEITSEFGEGGVGDELWQLFLDGERGNTFNLALDRRGVTPSAVQLSRLVDCYRAHTPDITLLPDAQRLLQRTPANRLGLITDGPAVSQQAKVDALGLVSSIEVIVLTSMFGKGHPKPAPESFLHVLARLGGMPSAAVYIGDNPAKDFAAPKDLGWTTVRIRRPGSLHFDVPNGSDVDHEVTDLDSISAC